MGFWSSLLVAIIGGFSTSIFVGWFAASQQIRLHEARVDDLVQDNHRWFRDRDWRVEAEKIAAEKHGVLRRPAKIVAAWAAAQERALWEYRDEMSVKRRRYREIRAPEGLPHRLLRSLGARPFPDFRLTDNQGVILASWRADPKYGQVTGHVNDLTRPELEPNLRRFEAVGDPCARADQLVRAKAPPAPIEGEADH